MVLSSKPVQQNRREYFDLRCCEARLEKNTSFWDYFERVLYKNWSYIRMTGYTGWEFNSHTVWPKSTSFVADCHFTWPKLPPNVCEHFFLLWNRRIRASIPHYIEENICAISNCTTVNADKLLKPDTEERMEYLNCRREHAHLRTYRLRAIQANLTLKSG